MEEQANLPKAPSVGKTIADVFVTPSEVFQSLKGTEQAPMLWVLPLLISILVVIATSITFFTNNALRSESIEMQNRAFQKMVEDGKMTPEQAEQAESRMESMGMIGIVFGIIGGSFFIALSFFGGTLFLWLANKSILKTTVDYVKHLEMYGIASWVGILGSIIALLMMIALGTMVATPSLALALLGNYDPANTMHRLLSAVNFFSIWQAIVIGIGLSKFSDKSIGAGIGIAVTLWIIWVLITNTLTGFMFR